MQAWFDKENSVVSNFEKNGPRHIITPMAKGIIEGPGVRAEILPGSSNWLSVRRSYTDTLLCALANGTLYGCSLIRRNTSPTTM